MFSFQKTKNLRARNCSSIKFHVRHCVHLMLFGKILRPPLARKQKIMMQLNKWFPSISFPPTSASWPRPRSSLIRKKEAVCAEAALVDVMWRCWQRGSWVEYRSQLDQKAKPCLISSACQRNKTIYQNNMYLNMFK